MAGGCECGSLKRKLEEGNDSNGVTRKFKPSSDHSTEDAEEVDVDAEEWEATWNVMCAKYKATNQAAASSSIPVGSIDDDDQPTPDTSRVLVQALQTSRSPAPELSISGSAGASSQGISNPASRIRLPSHLPQVSEALIRSLPYKAEYARRKCKCRKCGRAISAMELRMAIVKTQLRRDDTQEERWFHWRCFFKETSPKSVGDIGNFEILRWKDQQTIKEQIGGISFKDYLVETSSSGKSTCEVCEEKIDAGAIQISKLNHGGGVISVIGFVLLPCYFHLDCFFSVEDEFEFPDDTNKLPGFVNLSQDDQEIVTLMLQGKRKVPKVVDTEGEEEMDKTEMGIKRDIEKMYAIRDFLSNKLAKKSMKKKYVTDLLTYNNQQVPPDFNIMLDRLSDVMSFGALAPCTVCEKGQFVYRSGIGYQCNGQVSEFTKCLTIVENPPRKDFSIPVEMIYREILKEYVFEGVRNREIPRHAPIVEAGGSDRQFNMSPFEGFKFVLSTNLPGNVKLSLSKLIAKLNGTVEESLSADIAALISTKEEAESESLLLTEAWNLQTPVVSVNFVVGMSPETNLVYWMKRCLLSEYTRTETIETHLKKVNKEFESLLERRRNAGGCVKGGKVVLHMKDGCAVDPDCNVASVTHVYQEQGRIYSAVLNKTDSDTNLNSYYKIQLLEHDTLKTYYYVFRSWGRIGTVGRKELNHFMQKEHAKLHFLKQYKLKTDGNVFGEPFVMRPGGYVLTDVFYPHEEESVKESLDSKLPKSVQDLIVFIFDVQKMKDALLEYELDFEKMPLGKISLDQIMRAFVVLNELMETVKGVESDRKERLVADSTNRFFSLIPHSFGMDSVPMLANKAMVREKLEMLDQLMDIELAYGLLRKGNAQGGVAVDNHYNLLNATIEPLSQDSALFGIIEQYLRNTHGNTHSMYTLHIQNVFEVKREGETERFSKFSTLHNRQLLWHGSPTTNYAGILSQGLRIAPTEAPMTGYMFGKGIYFADMVSKSANYCHVNSSGSGLLLLCEVALGNTYQLSTGDTKLSAPPKGYHSVQGLGRTRPNPNEFTTISNYVRVPYGPAKTQSSSGNLLYNEYIVYDVAQVKIRYILKVDFKYGAR